MNRKQFFLLVIALAVLGAAAAALFWQDVTAYRQSGAKIGAKVFPDLKAAEVAEIRLKDAKGEVTLVNKEGNWSVKERGGYPANVEEISGLLIKLVEARVVQSDPVSATLLPRLELAEPGKGEGTGTLLEIKDKAGKTVAAATLGKTSLKKDPGNPLPAAQDGVPAGRFLVLAGKTDNAIVVGDPLANATARPGPWLARNFFKVDRIRTLTVAGEGANQWKITRTEEWGQWKFAAGGGDLDPSAAVGAVNALGSMTFTDVAIGVKEEDTEKPFTITAETFDNLTYVLTVAKVKEAGSYRVKFKLTGEPPKTRPAEKGEKPEDKERRDKEFANAMKNLEARVAFEQILGNWTYVIDAKALAPLVKERAQMIAQKRKPGEGPPPGMPPGFPGMMMGR